MTKLITVVVASACALAFSGPAVAADGKPVEKPAAEALEEKDEGLPLEAGFDFDFLSAYIWRNAIQNDEMVMQPCVWADYTFLDPFYAGFSIWQNYDLTNRRRDDLRRGLTETDYNVHAGATAWQSEDEAMSLGLEVGHEWYDNQSVASGSGGAYPDTREIYVKVTFDNEIVNVYGQVSWMYDDFGDNKSGVHYEIGFNKEVEVYEDVTLGADWNVNFGTGHYLNYLYGGTYSGTDADGERQYDSSSAGFGGTTVKVYLSWQVTEWFALGGVVAYTGVLNDSYRDALDEQDWYVDGDSYQRDFVWGGLQAKFSF